jgi:hypothetical protein
LNDTCRNNKIKFYCSCIRDSQKLETDLKDGVKVLINEFPKAGDLVIVKVLDDTCGYPSVENNYGRLVTLYNGDIFIGVIGDRRSGTNVVGEVPQNAIKVGDQLELLAQGGVIGRCLCVDNHQRKKQALPLQVIGFVGTLAGSIRNLRDYQDIGVKSFSNDLNKNEVSLYFVFGTSAEVGKTTMVCNMVRWLRVNNPAKKVACLKVCGTGRLKDKLNYRDSGGNICLDFVDAGWPTTYNMSQADYKAMFEKLYNYAKSDSDIIIFEAGGDLVDGNAQEAISFAKLLQAKKVLVVNDAMGALTGLDVLDYQADRENIFIASWKQNPFALAQRLNVPKVVNASESNDLQLIFEGV